MTAGVFAVAAERARRADEPDAEQFVLGGR